MKNYTPIQLDLLRSAELLFNYDLIDHYEFSRIKEKIKNEK